jgi:hypothetical protein
MPITGDSAWKEKNIGPEERIDRFFNLIDHAVENGIPLGTLYRREHLKEFLLYALRWCDAPGKKRVLPIYKEKPMPKLTLTSTFASSVIVGDPGIVTVTLPPKETKSIDVTEVQLRQLMPGLEKLKAVGWINYSVADTEEPATIIEKNPVKPAPSAPPKVIVPPAPAPVPAAPPETPAETPVAPATPEIAPEDPTVVVPEPVTKIEEAPAPVKTTPFEKRNRNR